MKGRGGVEGGEVLCNGVKRGRIVSSRVELRIFIILAGVHQARVQYSA